jgi:hypothetical protein
MIQKICNHLALAITYIAHETYNAEPAAALLGKSVRAVTLIVGVALGSDDCTR